MAHAPSKGPLPIVIDCLELLVADLVAREGLEFQCLSGHCEHTICSPTLSDSCNSQEQVLIIMISYMTTVT